MSFNCQVVQQYYIGAGDYLKKIQVLQKDITHFDTGSPYGQNQIQPLMFDTKCVLMNSFLGYHDKKCKLLSFAN